MDQTKDATDKLSRQVSAAIDQTLSAQWISKDEGRMAESLRAVLLVLLPYWQDDLRQKHPDAGRHQEDLRRLQGLLDAVRVDLARQQTQPEPDVPAAIWNTHGGLRTAFDATPWFRTASDEDIMALLSTEWGGDPRGEVEDLVRTMERSDPQVEKFLEAHRIIRMTCRTPSGYVCEVDEEKALCWLEKQRPALYTKVRERIDQFWHPDEYPSP
ncbi:MAG: hypothetical protein M0Z85_09815 [Gammaproteobacteria bacterium]|nr:hypothetical protein [Gammaproteobacteria bacterium]